MQVLADVFNIVNIVLDVIYTPDELFSFKGYPIV